jgi:hypothetical protein
VPGSVVLSGGLDLSAAGRGHKVYSRAVGLRHDELSIANGSLWRSDQPWTTATKFTLIRSHVPMRIVMVRHLTATTRHGWTVACPPALCSQMGSVPAVCRGGWRDAWSFHWSFHQAPKRITEPYWLDGTPDLSSEDETLRHGMDGRGSTSNPALGGSVAEQQHALEGQPQPSACV